MKMEAFSEIKETRKHSAGLQHYAQQQTESWVRQVEGKREYAEKRIWKKYPSNEGMENKLDSKWCI